MKTKKTSTEWQGELYRRELAGKQADDIVRQLCLTVPIDPVVVAKSELPLLRIGGRDFHDRFDGQLEYHASKNRFLLFYNAKYDAGRPSGTHHPRTRFSIAHELGHYFIERHRAYLMRGGKPHHSTTEFRSDQEIEREADAFAASLLMPSQLINPLVNQGELSFSRIASIAGEFETSIVSTTIRAVRLSHFPCAVAGIRDGKRAWMFVSDSLIEAGLYPGAVEVLSSAARERWESFRLGVPVEKTVEGSVRDWFQTFDRDDIDDLFLTQDFMAVPVMGTLLVLLAVDEDDLTTDEATDKWDE